MSLLRRLIGGRRAQMPAAVGGLLTDVQHRSKTISSSDLITEIGTLRVAGRYGDAHAAAETALQSSPDEPELHLAKGTTLLEWGRFRDARAALEEAGRHGLR